MYIYNNLKIMSDYLFWAILVFMNFTSLMFALLLQTLYSFCAYFVWIAFKKKEYENVRKEIGR